MDDWNFGKNILNNYHYSYRFPLGQVEIFLEIKDSHIENFKISGDFLNVLPIEDFESKFHVISYQPESIKSIINTPNFPLYIGGTRPNQLLYCFFAN